MRAGALPRDAQALAAALFVELEAWLGPDALAERLQGRALDLVEALGRAPTSPVALEELEAANAALQSLRALFRLAEVLHAFDPNTSADYLGQCDRVGRGLGAWLRDAERAA